jgi:hypothetical protein
MIGPRDTPFAFRMALEELLRNISQREGIDLLRLRRRVAFERLLARLFFREKPWCAHHSERNDTGPRHREEAAGRRSDHRRAVRLWPLGADLLR